MHMSLRFKNERHEFKMSCVPHEFQFLCPILGRGTSSVGLFVIKSGESITKFLLCVFVGMGGEANPEIYDKNTVNNHSFLPHSQLTTKTISKITTALNEISLYTYIIIYELVCNIQV